MKRRVHCSNLVVSCIFHHSVVKYHWARIWAYHQTNLIYYILLVETYRDDLKDHSDYHHVDGIEFLVAKARAEMFQQIQSSTRRDPKEVFDSVKVC